MTLYRNLDRGDVLPASWTDALQEQISTLASNLRLTLAAANVVRVTGGVNSAQVNIGIDGLYRWRRDIIDATVAGAAGVYDIFVTAQANSFSSSPAPDTDLTDYRFGLEALAQGTTPTTAGVVAYRKVGELDWDGTTNVTALRQTVGHEDATLPISPTALRASTPAIRASGVAGQSANLIEVRDTAAGLNTLAVKPGGILSISGQYQVAGVQISAANLSNGTTGTGALVLASSPTIASPTFTGSLVAPTPAADDNSTKVATTAWVIGQAYTSNPVMDGTAAPGTSLRWARGDHVHPTDTSRAPLVSPTFTGTPAAPTAVAGTNTTQIATTAFVTSAVGAVTSGSGGIAYLGNAQTFTAANVFSSNTGLTLDQGTAATTTLLKIVARNSSNTAFTHSLTATTTTLNINVGTASGTFNFQINSSVVASLDTSGLNIASGNYKIAGAQIAATNLSNGVTGTGAVALASNPTFTGNVTLNGTLQSTASGAILYRNQGGTGSVTYGSRLTADTNDRFQITADGTVWWGTGAAGVDTSLSRTAAGQLTTGALVLSNRLYTSTSAYLIGAGASGLALTAANAQQRLAIDNTGISFFGAATSAQKAGYGTPSVSTAYAALSDTSTPQQIAAAVTKLITDLKAIGLVAA